MGYKQSAVSDVVFKKDVVFKRDIVIETIGLAVVAMCVAIAIVSILFLIISFGRFGPRWLIKEWFTGELWVNDESYSCSCNDQTKVKTIRAESWNHQMGLLCNHLNQRTTQGQAH